MSDATRILNSISPNDPKAAEELLPLVYDELRKLARARMAKLEPGQTIQPTGLVHEVWLRISKEADAGWSNRAHFFHATAEAMRRIIVERTRQKQTKKRAHLRVSEEFDEARFAITPPPEEILALHEAPDRLAQQDASAPQLVKLRYFSGFTVTEAANALAIWHRSAERLWSFSKVWLHRELHPSR